MVSYNNLMWGLHCDTLLLLQQDSTQLSADIMCLWEDCGGGAGGKGGDNDYTEDDDDRYGAADVGPQHK